MDRPMTTEELFEKIKGILKEKGKLPDILDYGIATSRPVPIRIYEFELKNNLDYGGSEGIYLDLEIEYFEDGEWHKDGIGTFKTLGESREAMLSDGELKETQTANYFSNLYPIDCAVPSETAQSCRKYGTLPEHKFLPGI